jgi:hypothetical protein
MAPQIGIKRLVAAGRKCPIHQVCGGQQYAADTGRWHWFSPGLARNHSPARLPPAPATPPPGHRHPATREPGTGNREPGTGHHSRPMNVWRFIRHEISGKVFRFGKVFHIGTW